METLIDILPEKYKFSHKKLSRTLERQDFENKTIWHLMDAIDFSKEKLPIVRRWCIGLPEFCPFLTCFYNFQYKNFDPELELLGVTKVFFDYNSYRNCWDINANPLDNHLKPYSNIEFKLPIGLHFKIRYNNFLYEGIITCKLYNCYRYCQLPGHSRTVPFIMDDNYFYDNTILAHDIWEKYCANKDI